MTYWLNFDDTKVTKHKGDCEYVTQHMDACEYDDHTLQSLCKWTEFSTESGADAATMRGIHECRPCIVWAQ